MIPLRYVAIAPELLKVPEKLGNRMPLERAMAIVMLDPDTFYLPINIAHFCYQHFQELDKEERKRLVGNARHSYAELARLRLNRSNPNLTGREWVTLLQGNIHAVAAKMAELHLLMRAQPGVAFALDGEELIIAPFQAPALDLPPTRSHPRTRRRRRAAPPGAALPVRLPQPVLPPAPGVPQALERLDSPPSVHRRKRFSGVLVFAFALVLLGLPSAYAIYYFNLPRVDLADITEMGAPDEEAPSMVAKGRRFAVGDRLVFEGRVGTIKAIDRMGIQFGDEAFPAPDLLFFGKKMNVEGNYVVYPSSPRPTAGNFWLPKTKTLDEAKPGHLSQCC